MKKMLPFVLAIVCGMGGAYYYLRTRPSQSTVETLRTEPVKRGDLVSIIKATGTIEPEDVVDVGAQVMGRIEDLGVDLGAESADDDTPLQTTQLPRELDNTFALRRNCVRQCGLPGHEGDHPPSTARGDRPRVADHRPRIDYNSIVQVGTELAYIDATRYQAQHDQAMAALQRAMADLGQLEAKVEQATAQLRRAQQLKDIQGTRAPVTTVPIVAISESDYEVAVANDKVAKANLAIGKAEVAQRRAACELAKTDLDFTVIKSPVAGKILERRVNIGQTVVASLNAPRLFLIAKDLTRMQVWASVNEADIGRIRPGMKANFTVDTYPREVFAGEVKQVRLNAQMTQNVVTYTVIVEAPNPDERLLPYLTANVKFEVAMRRDVLLVPNAALRWEPAESQVDPSVELANVTPTDANSNDEERGRLWVAVGDGLVRPIDVVMHEDDGTWTEVSGADVKEGLSVVVGDQRPDDASMAVGEESNTKNPFLPQLPKGPRPPPPM